MNTALTLFIFVWFIVVLPIYAVVIQKKKNRYILGLYFIVASVVLIFFSLYYFKYYKSDMSHTTILEEREAMYRYNNKDKKVQQKQNEAFRKMFHSLSPQKQKELIDSLDQNPIKGFRQGL